MEINQELYDASRLRNSTPEEIAYNYLNGRKNRIVESLELLNSGVVGTPTLEELNSKRSELASIDELLSRIPVNDHIEQYTESKGALH